MLGTVSDDFTCRREKIFRSGSELLRDFGGLIDRVSGGGDRKCFFTTWCLLFLGVSGRNKMGEWKGKRE